MLAVIFLVEFASIFILIAEGGAPQANIHTAGDAIWWVIVTVATVGYGDLYPVTGPGRSIATVVIIAGVGLFGVLSGFLARNFLGGSSRGFGGGKMAPAASLDNILAEIQQIRAEQKGMREECACTHQELGERLKALEHRLDRFGRERE
jgi:voltage-gated potassium channel